MKMEILLEPTSNKLMVVTHWFTLIVLSALRRSDNQNMLSLMNLILMSILTDLQVILTKPERMTKPYSSHRFIANCFNAGNLKMEVKATNIILQGLPPEVYALVSNHKVIKELWERIQLLMQGTSLTKQARECKLSDEFDKFAYKKEESLRDFYLIFSLLLNDMNIYNMNLEQFQMNTKFLNTLPPEWSKFVTNVKLVRDLYTKNVDQLHAYLGQYEYHANEVRIMHERTSDPLALVGNHQMTKSPYQTHQQSYQHTQFQPQVSSFHSSQYGSPYHSSQYASQAQSSTPLSITYPSNDFQSSVYHNVYNPSSSIPQVEYAPLVHQQSDFSQPDTGLVFLVFQKGDDLIDDINHMMSFLTAFVTSRYPPTNNQLRNSFSPRQQATINNGRVTVQPIQGRQNSLAAADDLDAYNSDCDEINSAKIDLMANLSYYGFDNLTEDNKNVNELLTVKLERYKDQVRILKERNNVDKASDSCARSLEIDNLKNTLLEHLKERESLEQMTELSAEQVFWSQNSGNFEEPNLSSRTTIVEVPKKLPKVNMDGAVMSTKEYMKKVVKDVGDDEDFKSRSWVSATDYVHATGGILTGCLRGIKNFLKNGKLEQVVTIVKSCYPNAIGDLTVTMKDLSSTIPGTIHHKVIGDRVYGKDITVGIAMILANVSVFSLKPSKHHLNIIMRNVVKVFCKDTIPESGSGSG
uniref:Homologous recombination OB-fold protein OB-fold domain-containing protein n=1 Tax=Tanacetum cinerariifolium TaxID=118510 RepID=A0A699GFY7_TANCI|nr:hypothetical protein [Tanacetum cinerariifolium]